MPRDPNLIQNPDLVRRLGAELGMRAAHITPALAPTITPVIIAGDVTNRKSSEGQMGGILRPQGVTMEAIATGGATEAAVVFYNYPKTGNGTDFRVALRYLELQTRGVAVTRVELGWRDTSAAALVVSQASGLDSILDPAHRTAEFNNNNGGLGVFALFPGTGVPVAGNPFYTRPQGLAPVSSLVWRQNDFPAVIRRGTGLVLQVYAAPTVANVDIIGVFDVEAMI
jgi:hypothetical protein